MKRAGYLAGPMGLLGCVCVVAGLARCESRQVDPSHGPVGQFSAITTNQSSELTVNAIRYAKIVEPDSSVAICIVDREGRILSEVVTTTRANVTGGLGCSLLSPLNFTVPNTISARQDSVYADNADPTRTFRILATKNANDGQLGLVSYQRTGVGSPAAAGQLNLVSGAGNPSIAYTATSNAPSAVTAGIISRAESRAGTAAFLSSDGEAFTAETAFFIIQANFPPDLKNEDSGPLFGVEFSNFIASDIISIASRIDVRSTATTDVARLADGTNANGGIDNPQTAGFDATGANIDFQRLAHPNAQSGVALPNGRNNATGSGIIGIAELDAGNAVFVKGGVPLYRIDRHIGGIGVAGATNSTANKNIALFGQAAATAPGLILADRVFIDGIRIRYGQHFATPLPGVVPASAGIGATANTPATELEAIIDDNDNDDSTAPALDGNPANGRPQAHLVQGPRGLIEEDAGFADQDRPSAVPAYVQALAQTITNADNTTLATPSDGEAILARLGVFRAVQAGNTSQYRVVVTSADNTRTLPNPSSLGATVAGIVKSAIQKSPNQGPSGARPDFRQIGDLDGDNKTDELSFAQVTRILRQGVQRARITRAGIRRPLGSAAVAHVTVVDQNGVNLGCIAGEDATVFSYDVAYQKGRGCAFFSSSKVAFSARAIGWVAQPHYPPGIFDAGPGPLFGLQGQYNAFGNTLHPALNGFEVFPGGTPLYKGNTVIGGIGVSGDGVDQDDFISEGGDDGFQAPPPIRCDNVNGAVLAEGLRIGLEKMKGSVDRRVATLQGSGPLSAAQQGELSALIKLSADLGTRIVNVSVDDRLRQIPTPWIKFPRKPFVANSR